jgi:uncharacterized protein (DUF983 family)
MSSKPSGIAAFLGGKCPRCRSSKIFTHSFYNLFHFSEVHANCPKCGVKIEPEPGFFWGAMYFSYAINVAISVIAGFTLFFIFGDPELWVYIAVIVPTILILTPPMTRFSRLMMMYVIAPYRKYNPNALKK